MHYLGGKFRLARLLKPVICKRLEAGSGRFVEPFVGGFNLVPAVCPEVALCSDSHPGLFSLYSALQAGTFDPPESLSEDEYARLREKCDWSDPMTAFAAFGCSFAGKEWGGYARDPKEGRNYAEVARRSLLRKASYMRGVEFACKPYWEVEVRPGDTVYADPPYASTTRYSMGFDHEAFYRWCEETARAGALVLVSEFTCPSRSGWRVVWSRERKVQVNLKGDGAVKTELLIEVGA